MLSTQLTIISYNWAEKLINFFEDAKRSDQFKFHLKRMKSIRALFVYLVNKEARQLVCRFMTLSICQAFVYLLVTFYVLS